MNRLTCALALGSLVLVPLGCNGEGNTPGGEIAHTEFIETQFDAMCDYMVECGYATDQQLCLDAWLSIINIFPDLDAAIANGTVIYDAEQAQICVDTLRAATDCGDAFGEDIVLEEACSDVYQGTLEDGVACWLDEQCVNQECEFEDCMMACCMGTCAPPPVEQVIGGDCLSGEFCVDGAHCDFDTGVCVADASAGEACSFSNDCASGLECVGDVCQVLPGEGEACLDGECGFALGCNAETVICEALRGEGEACIPAASTCAFGLVCDAESTTCMPPGGVGSPCMIGFLSYECGADGYCADGTCLAQKADGEACGSDSECLSDFCGSGGCETHPVCVE